MRISQGLLTLATSLVLGTACTQSPQQPEIQAGARTGQKADGATSQTPPEREQISPSEQANQSTSVPLVLDENAIKKAYAIDTSNMKYKFRYLTTLTEGDVKFEAGKATLNFKDLKDGVKGDLVLELLEASVVKLRGETKDLVLAKGPNNINLILKSVGGGGDTADLIVSVEMDQPKPSTGGGQPSTGGGQPSTGGGQPSTGGGQPSTGGGQPSTGGGNPNGVSFAKNVTQVVEKHCTECHHNGGQVPDLTSKTASEAQFTKIIARIEGSGAPMPPKPRDSVSSSELEILKSWKTQGFNQ